MKKNNKEDTLPNYIVFLSRIVGGIKFDLCHMYVGYMDSTEKSDLSKSVRKKNLLKFVYTYRDHFNFENPHWLVQLFYDIFPGINQNLESWCMRSTCDYILWKLGVGEKPIKKDRIIAERTIKQCGYKDLMDNDMGLMNAVLKQKPLDNK